MPNARNDAATAEQSCKSVSAKLARAGTDSRWPFDEIVQHQDVVVLTEQHLGHHAADVAGAASHRDTHTRLAARAQLEH